jgi:hypothetical protein
VSLRTGCVPGGHVVGGGGTSHVTTSRNVGTVPAGQVAVTGGAHGIAPHGPSTGAGPAGAGVTAAAGGGGGGATGGFGAPACAGGAGDATTGFAGGATSVAAGGVGAGLRAMMASAGSVRTSICGSIEMARTAGTDSDPAVGSMGFTEQAADPRPAATTHIKCLTLMISSPFAPPVRGLKRQPLTGGVHLAWRPPIWRISCEARLMRQVWVT